MAKQHSEIISAGLPWPPTDDLPRINRQKLYRTMFNQSEPSLLVRGVEWKSKPVETFTSAFVKMVSISYANLLVGEQVGLSIEGPGKQDEATTAMKRIARGSGFGIVAFNACIGQSVEGRHYIKLRRGKKTSRSKTDEVMIENLWAQNVIRFTDPGSSIALGFCIWQELCIQKEKFIQFEIHYQGEIWHELWSIQGDVLKEKVNFEAVLGYLPIGITDPLGGMQETGVDDLLVFEIDNIPTNGWSIPDLHGSENVVRLLEDRLSRDSEILNKHASPKLAVPTGVLDDKGQVSRQTWDGMVFQVDPGSNLFVPEYITWDPKVEQSFTYWDKLLGVLLANTGLTHQIVGFESKDGFADSGTALRLRMIPTLAMVNAKRLNLSPAFTNSFRAALALADGFGDYGSTALDHAHDVVAGWRDGIPEDPIESATVSSIKTGARQTMSIRRSIRINNPDMTEEMIDAELSAIQAEEQASLPNGGARAGRTVALNLAADQQ